MEGLLSAVSDGLGSNSCFRPIAIICSCAYYCLLFGNVLGKRIWWRLSVADPRDESRSLGTPVCTVLSRCGYAYVGIVLLGLWLLILTDQFKKEAV